jgi:hypothetical protein
MPRLIPCPSCSSHVLPDERECPHCGVSLRTIGAPRVAAVVVGLALGGCIIPQPAYGIPDPSGTEGTEGTAGTGTGSDTDSAGTMSGGMTDGMTGTVGSEGTSTGMADSTTGDTEASTDTTSVGEPEYGVPETTSSSG